MIDFAVSSYAVFFREMVLLKSKILRFGYVFYSVSSPVIYLLAFGLGFGSRIDIGGGNYGAFLVQGIVCMSSMTNSYNLIVTSVSMGRLHSGSFQTLMTSPVSSFSVMAGLIASGVVRGFLASFFIVAAGLVVFKVFPFGLLSLIALILNVAFFSSIAVITGLLIKDMESNALITNFVIMPMSFFSGTFYPLDFLPDAVKGFVYIFPLSHTNIVMRAEGLNGEVLTSLILLVVLTLVSFVIGSFMLSRYSE
jgi:ABC-type multidrug transport system permease subunit